MRSAALVLAGAACSSQAPEPPEPFLPHDLVKILEPSRERRLKQGTATLRRLGGT